MDTVKQKLKEIIKNARKLTLCVDGWSKRGLTSPFMGVSPCFYHPGSGQVHHALLNLHYLEHPHTGEAIARCIDQTLDARGIEEHKVLLILTVNSTNIVKVRLLRDKKREQSRESDGAVSQAQPRGTVLEEYGVWGPLLRAARSLYDRSRSLVLIGGKFFRRSQGLEGVRFGDHTISSLFFANDVVMLAPSVQDLQHALGRFAAECEAAGMRISTSKSKAMVLSQKRVACPLQVGKV
ncbi:hypothetical protein F2P79_016769 [Pimephales promelas]|nr:hypothetical protein F2P79_016769 [Pimephales promelas]